MAKGIIYCMSCATPGVVKIGKTDLANFKNRMNKLEKDGYANFVGFKRQFAIEVKEYSEKEKLLHEIFSKSQIADSECFAVNLKIVIQLLSAFDGKQIFPETISKDKVFDKATLGGKKGDEKIKQKEVKQIKKDENCIPDGKYYLERKVAGFGKVNGTIVVKNGKIVLLQGCKCAPLKSNRKPEVYNQVIIKDFILQNDVECSSLSYAALIVVGQNANGWAEWKTRNGQPLLTFRGK